MDEWASSASEEENNGKEEEDFEEEDNNEFLDDGEDEEDEDTRNSVQLVSNTDGAGSGRKLKLTLNRRREASSEAPTSEAQEILEAPMESEEQELFHEISMEEENQELYNEVSLEKEEEVFTNDGSLEENGVTDIVESSKKFVLKLPSRATLINQLKEINYDDEEITDGEDEGEEYEDEEEDEGEESFTTERLPTISASGRPMRHKRKGLGPSYVDIESSDEEDDTTKKKRGKKRKKSEASTSSTSSTGISTIKISRSGATAANNDNYSGPQTKAVKPKINAVIKTTPKKIDKKETKARAKKMNDAGDLNAQPKPVRTKKKLSVQQRLRKKLKMRR